MPTAILDVDLRRLPAELLVAHSYRAASILIRLDGNPLGKVILPVQDGRVLAPDLAGTLMEACGSRYWEARVRDILGMSHDQLSPNSRPSCSIAICTRERPDDLRECLAALTNLPDDGQEILVIDNAPRTDATLNEVERFHGVRYIREDRPGLDVARNRALREARHEIVAFTDDDARVDPAWLRALLRNFADPLVLCVTGLTLAAELETPAQEAFEQQNPFGRGFIRRVFEATTHNPLQAAPMGAGVNMALRREAVLRRLDGFDVALDAGTPTQSGGDHELFTRILTAGFRIVYEPAALVWHRHRREWRELRKTIQGYGTGVYAAWTRSLLIDGEFTVPLMAWGWFRHDQLPALVRSILRHPNRRSLRLALSELWGCALGPWAYFLSAYRARARDR
jgi:glycosyltransferase involved in cell wall biosynthesis